MGWFHHIIFHSTNPEETVQLKKILGREAAYMEASNFPRILPFAKENYPKQSNTLKLLSVARVSPEKNSIFMLECLSKAKGNISLTVIGTYKDESYFQQFMQHAEKLPSNITLNYLGHKKVTELEEYYKTHDVFILPTTGENYGHAIIEALTSGLPCIISEYTPWNGLEAEGAGYNCKDDACIYANAINKYFEMEPAEFLETCKTARNYALSRINLEAIRKSYIDMLG